VSALRPVHTTLLLVVCVLAAGAYALTRDPPAAVHPRVVEMQPEPAPDPAGEPGESDPSGDDLTEDDPSMGQASPSDVPPDDEPPALEWSVPAAWRTVPSPSSMRIATYSVPRAAGDSSDAEVSVTRAGGDVASNVERWVAQFEDAGAPSRRQQRIHGLDVTVVEIEGAYTSAMHPDTPPRPGWALLGAIVGTRGQPYFFKMTGPAATVHGARGAFAKLVESLRPTD
jgi:hypothetical protein